MRAFEPISIDNPHFEANGSVYSNGNPLANGIGIDTAYADFLEQDGKTIRIRKIDNFVNNNCSLVYYDELPKPVSEITVTDRLSDLDV